MKHSSKLTKGNLKGIDTLSQLLDLRYGKKGTPTRKAFEYSVKVLKQK